MPSVVFFRERDGRVPVLDWLAGLPHEANDKCVAQIERLRLHGHMLRRPYADYLRDGVYELRAKRRRVNYRLLYFFHGQQVVVLSHGITKQQAEVPPLEIERARQRKTLFEADPDRHTHVES